MIRLQIEKVNMGIGETSVTLIDEETGNRYWFSDSVRGFAMTSKNSEKDPYVVLLHNDPPEMMWLRKCFVRLSEEELLALRLVLPTYKEIWDLCENIRSGSSVSVESELRPHFRFLAGSSQ